MTPPATAPRDEVALAVSREFMQTARRLPTVFDSAAAEWPKGADYYHHHYRVGQIRGKPSQCEDCGTTDPKKRYEWASLTKNYADPMDYKRLCRRCHLRMDEVNKRLGLALRGNVRVDMQGERHHQAKLTDANVRDIRSRGEVGKGYAALAREFGVSEPTIKRIVTHETWRHIP